MQAVVLSAGEGKRLKKFFPHYPKALIPVFERPLISFTLNKILKAKINEIYIVIKPELESIFKSYLKNYRVKYLYQEKALGTAKALLVTEKVIKKDFLLSYCDLITNFNYQRLIKYHLKYKSAATLLVKKDKKRDNEVLIKDGKILKIIEKPDKSFSEYTAIGLMCLNPLIFHYLKKLKKRFNEFQITDGIQKMIDDKKVVRYIKTQASRWNINSYEDIKALARQGSSS